MTKALWKYKTRVVVVVRLEWQPTKMSDIYLKALAVVMTRVIRLHLHLLNHWRSVVQIFVRNRCITDRSARYCCWQFILVLSALLAGHACSRPSLCDNQAEEGLIPGGFGDCYFH